MATYCMPRKFVLCIMLSIMYQLMKYEVVFNLKRRKQRKANLKRKLQNF